MAEIKSTLDLIMEKTAGLTLSDEEKERTRAEERGKRAKGVVLRLIEGRLRLKDLGREIERTGEDDPKGFKRLVGLALIREADLGSPDQGRLAETLTTLWPDRAGEIEGLVSVARAGYDQELALLGRAEIQKVLDELRERGIHGPAIRPRVVVDMDQSGFKEELIKWVEAA